jgi:pimeloyl-ACP methyl ester carboxylesterase
VTVGTASVGSRKELILMIRFQRRVANARPSAWVLLRLGGVMLAAGLAQPVCGQEEITFRSGDNTLKGVLLLPKTPGPHPAVAFVHGSGSLDRNDWTSHPALREHLARHGIASLCWDKPGVGASTGDWTGQSFRDRALEAVEAVKFLKRRPDIDGKHVGLWGISQGGWVCPLAASLSSDVAFLILVSAPAGTVGEQDLYRIEHEMRADGRPAGDIEKALAFARRRIEFFRGGSYEKLDAAQKEAGEEGWFKEYVHPLRAKDFAFGMKNIAYDGRAVLKDVKCPVLVLVGEHDTVVPAKQGAAIIEEALKKAGNTDVTVKTLPGADHFMHAATTGGPRERFAKDRKKEFVADYFLTITGWLSARVRPEP